MYIFVIELAHNWHISFKFSGKMAMVLVMVPICIPIQGADVFNGSSVMTLTMTNFWHYGRHCEG